MPWPNAGATPTVTFDSQKRPTMIGLTIPAKLIDSLPVQRSEAIYAMQDAGLVQSANLQWHPLGHDPAHVYDVPHFDVHFFTITESVRQTIVPGAVAGTILPAKEYLIPDGILAPGFVPGMGMHNIPKSQPEFSGGTFSVSPIVGYWNGDIAFFEVMFTKAWMQQKSGTVGIFPQPVSVKQHGSYPTKYSVSYDKAKDVYQVALTDFIER
ncbi:MAG: DUF5602 domain-containing protein [Candidatus Velthaea sp.]